MAAESEVSMFRPTRRQVSAVVGLLACLAALLWVLPRAAPPVSVRAQAVPLAPGNFDRPTYSSPIVLSADGNLVWAVNPDDDSVSVIGNLDTTPSVIRRISVGDEPQSIALDTNNVDPSKYRAYVANAADNSVTILLVTDSGPGAVTVVNEGTLVTGAEPWNIVAAPDGRRIFVANSGQDTITVIRTDTGFNLPTIVDNVDLSDTACNVGDTNRHYQPRGMAVNLTGDRLYVTRFLSFTKAGGVQSDDAGKEGVVCRLLIPPVINAGVALTVAGPILLPGQITGFRFDSNADNVPDTDTSAYPNQLQSIVIRGNRAYVPNIAASPSPPLRFNLDTQAFVNVIDNASTGTPASAGALNLHLGARDPEPPRKRLFFANPWAIAFTNESGAGNAYVVSSGSDLLVKLNVDDDGELSFTQDISTTRYIDLNDPADPDTQGANAGKNPLGIVIRNVAPGNNRAFVLNYISRNVSVVDLDNDEVEQVIGLTPPPPPGSFDEQLQVGKEIFFSSRGHFDGAGAVNERLSSDGWQNCASCHFQGLTDSVIWRFGSGPRKSVPLNATWSPHNPDDQRILNYSAIFDEVQDFELNIRNVSGPGPVSAGPPPVLDPLHGLIFGATPADAPAAVPPFIPIANAGRPQFTVTLPNSTTAWPALDALKEWVRFAIRTPNGALTTEELTAGGGDTTGGLNPDDVANGRRLFFRAGCQNCHGGTKWTVSHKDFVSPPAGTEVLTEADTNGATAPNPNAGQYLPRFLSDIDSFNLNVNGAGNQIPGQPLIGGIELDAGGRDALGIDYDGNGQGAGFNIPALLGIWAVQPYYHNGACETLNCVLANVNHRTAGNPNAPNLLNSAPNQQRLVAFLKTLDAETDFPFNLSVNRHDIFVDPPIVFKGTQVVVGANVSLFGVRSDLEDLAADLGITDFTVRFELSPPGSPPLTVNVPVPADAFLQDFGQTVVTTTWEIPDNTPANLGRIRVTVDADGDFPEVNELDNTAQRRVIIRSALPDTTPPQISLTRISDDDPFGDNDPVIQTNEVQVKIVASDPAGGGNASGVKDFCIVSYTYNYVLRVWIPQLCEFAPLPTPETGTQDTFIIDTTLQNIYGVAYAFVWVRDGAGNVSRVPGFDVVSFVPNTPISLNRNNVLILRLPLAPGQNLAITADLDGPGNFGDVDIAVFDDFTNPSATRIALSANNGPVDEEVIVSGEGRRQVEIRAVTNSRFTLTVESTAQVAVDDPVAAAALDADETISVAGPPARQTAIGEPSVLFAPSILYQP
jgi:cytochrome c peroxidase